jgi:hypothetical protein
MAQPSITSGSQRSIPPPIVPVGTAYVTGVTNRIAYEARTTCVSPLPDIVFLATALLPLGLVVAAARRPAPRRIRRR